METSAHMIRHWLQTIDSYSSNLLYAVGTVMAGSTAGETEAQRVGHLLLELVRGRVLIAGRRV